MKKIIMIAGCVIAFFAAVFIGLTIGGMILAQKTIENQMEQEIRRVIDEELEDASGQAYYDYGGELEYLDKEDKTVIKNMISNHLNHISRQEVDEAKEYLSNKDYTGLMEMAQNLLTEEEIEELSGIIEKHTGKSLEDLSEEEIEELEEALE